MLTAILIGVPQFRHVPTYDPASISGNLFCTDPRGVDAIYWEVGSHEPGIFLQDRGIAVKIASVRSVVSFKEVCWSTWIVIDSSAAVDLITVFPQYFDLMTRRGILAEIGATSAIAAIDRALILTDGLHQKIVDV